MNEQPFKKARRQIRRLEAAGEPIPGSLYVKAKMKLPLPVTVARVDWTVPEELLPMGNKIPVVSLFGWQVPLCSQWAWENILNRGER